MIRVIDEHADDTGEGCATYDEVARDRAAAQAGAEAAAVAAAGG